jgi:hypothetical protein
VKSSVICSTVAKERDGDSVGATVLGADRRPDGRGDAATHKPFVPKSPVAAS